MSGTLFGHEEQLLNGIWFSLLGIEVAMVLGVVVSTLLRVFKPQLKQKMQ
jgi:hypothetical protein